MSRVCLMKSGDSSLKKLLAEQKKLSKTGSGKSLKTRKTKPPTMAQVYAAQLPRTLKMVQNENALELFIPGQLPGMNEVVESSKSCRGKSNQYARDKKAIGDWIRIYLSQGKLPQFKECKIGFHWVEPDKKRDPDNISAGGKKFILDALVSIGVIPTDSHRCIKGFTGDDYSFDKSNPGSWVRIVPVEAA